MTSKESLRIPAYIDSEDEFVVAPRWIEPRVEHDHPSEHIQQLRDSADVDAAKLLLSLFRPQTPQELGGNINLNVLESPDQEDFIVGKTFPCTLRELWDLVSEQAQQRGYCVKQGKGSELRDIPGGNRLVLECSRAGFTDKQLQEFRASEGNDSDDDFIIQKKRKFTKKSLQKQKEFPETLTLDVKKKTKKSIVKLQVWLSMATKIGF